MKKTDLLQLLDKIAPLSLAMEWDNCGMQTELGKTEINKVYAALEVTDQVIEHAAYLGCGLVIRFDTAQLWLWLVLALAICLIGAGIYHVKKSHIDYTTYNLELVAAAENGDAYAQAALGDCYLFGNEGEKGQRYCLGGM